jgi:dephospho-CoA kinase
MISIGITGGVGAGKSKILEYIEKKCDCFVLTADRYAEELEMRGNVCYEPLVELLGKDVLSDNLEIDRKKMASKVFEDESLLKKVNDIVHPAVKTGIIEMMDRFEKAGNIRFFFLEAALLIECGYKEILDEIWYVHADVDIRRKRLKEARNYSDEKIDNILASQLDSASFSANADFVINNSGSLENSYVQIDERLSMYNYTDGILGDKTAEVNS